MRTLEQRPGPGAAVLARSGPVRRQARRGDLDALRALVVVGLVFFHSAVIFGAGEFPVKAAVENRACSAPALRTRLMESVASFTGGKFQDDATLIVVAVD